jgi:putative methylase
MGKRALEGQLAVVAGFENPRASLEQYPTPPGIAAHIVHLADLQGDLASRTVLDLGTGTGMLALGAALRGPSRVVALELDRSALAVARDNERRLGSTTPVHWIAGDATDPPVDPGEPTTVLTNPPFGAQDGRRGADRAFLLAASRVADVSYSIHNAGSRSFVESLAADEGGEVTHAFGADFAVDAQFEFHEEERRELDTEVFRIEWR